MQLERWREERRVSGKKPGAPPASTTPGSVIRIEGSHDIALNMLLTLLRQKEKDVEFTVTSVGSLGGLIAIQEGRADIAGTHLLDEKTGEYNVPFIKRVLPGIEMVLVNLVYRVQGLMFAAGNPRSIRGLYDL